MKVTVNFGSVRVIVPCGNGDIFVKDLMDLAITRYKKATGKPSSAWVTIHNLKSSSDGGILDPDDRLNDVADDREQIIAIFEEQISPLPPHNGGDGTSASSVGTDSPDIFQNIEHGNLVKESFNCVDVEITGDHIPLGVTSLQVRRGSEPALNRLSPVTINPDPTKRWSAAVIIDDNIQHIPKKLERNKSDDELCRERGEGSGGEDRTPFSRGSGRHSMLAHSHPEMYRWMEAADKQLLKTSRKEPLGGSSPEHDILTYAENKEDFSEKEEKHTVIVLKNEAGPLGIHVVPDYDNNGRDMGLVIQGIEPGGRIDQDGRLHVSDRIIDINGHSLQNVSFQKAQDIFKDALKAPEIRLCLLRGTLNTSGPIAVPKKPPPVYPKPTNHGSMKRDIDLGNELVEGEERGGINSKVATITPTKKIPPVIPLRNPNTALTANTRKIGKRIHIQLSKGPEGLGFSVTTRDNPAGGNCPIYIKNILPKGAAIQDGRLKPGDRLLEVNSIEMTGKSQTEAVTILRNTPLGGTVDLVVSRQDSDISPTSSLLRNTEMLSERGGDTPSKRKEILTFEIPLNDPGSAGLGVSVKGKTSTEHNGTVDLGIFIKSVIPGGAAFKDKRLKTNDQLISINNTPLLGMSNSEAMETLRRAMSQENGITPASITLSVSRRIPSQVKSNDDDKSQHARSDSTHSMSTDSYDTSVENLDLGNSSTADSSATSNNSENTVIYLPKGSNKDFVDMKNNREVPFGTHHLGRNPVLERLTGKTLDENSNGGMYSDLHQNNENWKLHPTVHKITDDRTKGGISATLKTPSGEMILIENDNQNWPTHPKSYNKNDASKNPNSASSSNSQPSEKEKTEVKYDSQLSLEDNNSFCRDGFGRQSISEKRHAQLDAKNTDTYQRNKKAREERKRHRTDPSNSEQSEESNLPNEEESAQDKCDAKQSYQVKANSGHQLTGGLVKSNSADSLVSLKQCPNERSCQSPGCPYHSVTPTGGDSLSSKGTTIQLGPSLGMRKSSSLESLQTMVHELQKKDDTEFAPHPVTRVIRGRGCNESFRAAVDRSYEAPVAETMETLEEESESGSSGGQTIHGSSHSNFNSHPTNMAGVNSNQDAVIDPYQRKVNKARKKSIFKGLGSVFKFGKNKKPNQEAEPELNKEELEQETERIQARLAAKEEQERIQEQYRKLLEQQRQQENYTSNSNPPLQGQVMSPNEFPMGLPCNMSPSRQERMQQLRAQHQRRHQERQGLYPQDEQEEWYEQEIKETIDKKQRVARRPLPPIPLQQICHNYNYQRKVFPKRYETEVMHTRSHSFDIYKEMERPGSRMGIAADPSKYSHYMNYKEIQQHLRQIQQSQQHIKPIHRPEKYSHHQTSSSADSYSPTRKERPISNYYEYESASIVQPRMQMIPDSHTNSLPRRNHTSSQQTTYHKAQLVSLYHQQQYQKHQQTDHRNSKIHHRHEYNGVTERYRTTTHFSNSTGFPSNSKKDVPGSKV